MSALGYCRHVQDIAGLVVDMGNANTGDVLIDRIHDFVSFGKPDRVAVAELLDEALNHVVIRREVAAFHDDDSPVWLKLKRRRHDLVQVDARRIGQHDLVRFRADQWCDLSAKSLGELVPPRRIHAADQSLGPLLLDHLSRTFRSLQGHGAERIAIEVNNALRQEEFVPKRRQGVLLVEPF